jgi:UDP-N-acetylmuramate dehydrogenase
VSSLTLPSGLVIERDFKLAPLTSWLVGGRADFLVQPKTVEELKEALRWAKAQKLAVTVLGGGTNVLVSDKGVRGLTIALRKMSGLESKEEGGKLKLTCLTGTSKSELLKIFLKFRLEPALFLAGLPGDVGGGIVMNAGVGEMFQPREFVEITEWIEVLRDKTVEKSGEKGDDFEIVRLPKDKLIWNYRHCEGWKPGIVVRVGLAWPLEPSVDILQRVKAANQIRLSKQPLDMPSCGSVFRNPEGHKSGQLIENSGLKGFAVGGAKVSEKHANFIVNFNQATAGDVHQVISHVQATVKSKKGVDLHTEVVYLGDWAS